LLPFFTEQNLNYETLLEHRTCNGACLGYWNGIKGSISLVWMWSNRPSKAFFTFFKTDTVLT